MAYIEKPLEEHPVYKPLTEPPLLLGVPPLILYFIGYIAFVTLMAFRSWHLLPLCVLIYFSARHYAQKDPYFFNIYTQTSSQKSFYR